MSDVDHDAEDRIMIEETPEIIAKGLNDVRQAFDEIQNEKREPLIEGIKNIARIDEDNYLLRYLRTDKFNLEKTLFRLSKAELYFNDNVAGEQMTALRFKKILSLDFLTALNDKVNDKGQAMIFMKYELCDYNVFTAKYILTSFSYWVERQMKNNTKFAQALSKGGMAGICDCSNIGWKNFNLEVEKLSQELMEKVLPARIGLFVVVDQPFLFTAMYALIKPFMSKKSKERTKVIGSNYEKLSTKYFRPEDVPETYGGTMKFDAAAYARATINEWIDLESEDVQVSGDRADASAETFGVKLDEDGFVEEITEGGVAATIGVQQYDRIVKINNQAPQANEAGDIELKAQDTSFVVDTRRVVFDVYGNRITEPLLWGI